jgi:hypothetical protein
MTLKISPSNKMAKTMKTLTILAGLVLGIWLYSAPAHAAYMTGNDLSHACGSEKTEDIFSCMHYIAGVIDYQVMLQSLGAEPVTDFCLPEDLPLEKAAVAVMLYLKKSPQQASFIAAEAVTMALHEAWPCGPVVHKKKKKK